MNSVQLIGNLTRDPEHRVVGAHETSVCSLRLAVTGRRRTGDGVWVKKTGYFDVTTFGTLADTCAEYLAKGRKVAVSGRLDYQEWKTDDGVRSKVEVIASEVEFLSPAPQGGGEASAPAPADQADPEPAADPAAAQQPAPETPAGKRTQRKPKEAVAA